MNRVLHTTWEDTISSKKSSQMSERNCRGRQEFYNM